MNSKLSKKDIARSKDRLSQYHLRGQQHNSLIEHQADPPTICKPLHPKQRKHSRRDLRTPMSPNKLVRSKSRTTHEVNFNSEQNGSTVGNINALYHELMTIKSEYTHLKTSYHQLAEQKETQPAEKGESGESGSEIEIERLKKEFYRSLEA